MAMIRATVRRWGSSLATVIPPHVLKEEGIQEGDEVQMEVRKARSLRDLFGILQDAPLDAQKIKDRSRREDYE